MFERKPTILIVDDQRNNRQMIKLSLQNENYQFIEASNGLKAIELCEEHDPDIILMDAIMPVMDGFKATKFLREIEQFKRTPILMITILSNKEDRINAIECGVTDFITKPFDKLELIARCKSYVNISNVNRKYILSSKNIYTNLPNKNALMEDIAFCSDPKLVLFRIEDYELIEEFYSDEITERIELEFSKNIYGYLKNDCKNAILYHISEGEFALLNDKPNKEKMKENCTHFFTSVKNSVVEFNEMEYDINIVISYSYGSNRLFEHARMGLNHAIKTNQNIVFANDVMKKVHKDSISNIDMIKTIKSSLKNKEIVSHFQPIYNNITKEIEKYESLVRIINDEDILYPVSFLSAARSGKYSQQLTKVILDNSFEALQMTNKDISINLSTFDIEDEEIREYIINYLSKCETYSKRIIFELLENEGIHSLDSIISFIEDIKKLGVRIAIDDFGSGYSNFKRLLQFKPDILKIDGSLIKDIHLNEFNRNMVASIQSFADKANILTVAEYVENDKIFDVINEIGVNYTQGYYIGKADVLKGETVN